MAYTIEGQGKMTKFLFAAAAFALAQPAHAQASDATSVTNPESDVGFTDRGNCEAALAGMAKAANTGPHLSGSIHNRALGAISRCTKVDGEYLIVVYPAGSNPSPDA